MSAYKEIKMTNYEIADTLHRLMKKSLDNGTALSIEEAGRRFLGYKLRLSISPDQAREPIHQATLLTAVALGRRVFLGGVYVEGIENVPLSIPLKLGETLDAAIEKLGGIIGRSSTGAPLIMIGSGPQPRRSGFNIRTVVSGWRGGCVPIHSSVNMEPKNTVELSAMLAAALAINEAFLYVDGGLSIAGKRNVGMSLWKPQSQSDWTANDPTEPKLAYLPSCLWLIGLGHLGQAYLWGLGLLPYNDQNSLSLVLQDVDEITPSTESTSILSESRMVGQKKTRAMAKWAEERGFSCSVHERLFSDDFVRQESEPAIALCGIDNALGRRALDKVGFDLVVEAGLGRGHRDFRSIRLHVLPGTFEAAKLWAPKTLNEEANNCAAYIQLLESKELDQCGITLLAGKAVGAPFVGAVAASLALSEVLRLLHGGNIHQIIDLDLLCIEQRVATLNQNCFNTLNPGFVTA